MAVSSLTGMVSTAQLSAFAPGLKAAGADALLRSDPQSEAPRLGATQTRDQVRNTRFGQVSDALQSLSSFAGILTSSSRLGTNTNLNVATSSDQSVLTASADSTAVETGNVIHVSELARAQQLVSNEQESASASIGSGFATTLTFAFGEAEAGGLFSQKAGTVEQTVSINGSNNSLAGISAAINEAGIGVAASLVRSSSGVALQLDAASGVKNSLKITVSGDGAISDLLTFNPGNDQKLTQTRAGRDAQISVGDRHLSSESNTVSRLIDGVTLELKGKGTTLLNVATAEPTLTKVTSGTVKNFVSAFNRVLGLIDRAKQEDPDITEKLDAIRDRLEAIAAAAPATVREAPFRTLGQIGITQNADKTLELDEAKLAAALTKNEANVTAFFTGANVGIADRSLKQLAQTLSEGGTVETGAAQIDRDLEASGAALDSHSFFESSVQRDMASQFAGLNVTLTDTLLDGPTLQGLLGSNAIPELDQGRSTAGNRMLLSRSNVAFQQSVGNQLRAFPGQLFRTVV